MPIVLGKHELPNITYTQGVFQTESGYFTQAYVATIQELCSGRVPQLLYQLGILVIEETKMDDRDLSFLQNDVEAYLQGAGFSTEQVPVDYSALHVD